MPATDHTESVRINLRTSTAAKALIGSSVSSLTLSKAAFEAFVATCEKPPQPTNALRKLMATRELDLLSTQPQHHPGATHEPR